MYVRVFKPVIDISIALLALGLLLPILVATMIAIFVEDGRPILFIHDRTGRGGRTFNIFKFRSMEKDSAIVESSQAGTLRVTRVGSVIRRLNIDELPQLFNVLKQDMSIVGPRPALPNQTDLHELRRLNGAIALLPGITGLAQIKSYDGMAVEDKAGFDEEYVKSVSVFTDMNIVIRTFGYLLKRPPTY
jgi:O-antigen biosynthesis protein WbqP